MLNDTKGQILAEAAKDGKLILFVGAGISTIAPACLPSWWQLNRSVLHALRDTCSKVASEETTFSLAKLVEKRQDEGKFPPEYQAELIASRLSGEKYFQVLQCLDGEHPNRIHLLIAALAKAGAVKAILTTNFDRLLESAFERQDIPLDVYSSPSDFEKLPNNLKSFEQNKSCSLIKLHGSVENPSSLVDTLSQRKKGFSLPVKRFLRVLHGFGPWLVLGYSGGDLEAAPNYLELKGESERAIGFRWLLREGEKPRKVLQNLVDDSDGKSSFIYGDFLEYLEPLAEGLLLLEADSVDEQSAKEQAEQRVAEHTSEWAKNFGALRCGVFLAELGEAAGEFLKSVALLEEIHQRISDEDRKTEAFAYVAHALAEAYQEQGRYDDAFELLQEGVGLLERFSKEKQANQLLIMLASLRKKQGRLSDALEIAERAKAQQQGRKNEFDVSLLESLLADIYFAKSDYEKAREIHEKRLSYVTKEGDQSARANTLTELGNIDVMCERYGAGRKRHLDSLAIYERLGDDDGQATCLTNLGNIDYLQHDYEEAFKHWSKSRDTYERLGQVISYGHLSNNLALLFQKQDKNEEAEDIFKGLLAMFEKAGDLEGLAKTTGNLGSLQRGCGNYKLAMQYYEKALAFFDQMGNESGKSPWLREIGVLFREQEDWEQAIVFHEQSFALEERFQEYGKAADNAHDLALLCDLENLSKQALEWAEKAAFYYKKAYKEDDLREAEKLIVEYKRQKKGKSWLRPMRLTRVVLILFVLAFLYHYFSK